MASLADLIAASAGSSPSYGNADLKRKPHDWSTDESAPFGTVPSSLAAPTDESPVEKGAAPYVAPDGGRAEQDRLLEEAKGTLKRIDPFAKMLERTGNVAAMDTVADREASKVMNVPGFGPVSADQFFENFGRGMHGLMSPTAVVRGGYGALKGGASAVLGGLASIPEGVQAEWDIAHNLPDTIRSLPELGKDLASEAASGASDTFNNWALNPEQGGEAVAEALGGVAAPDALVGALRYGPQLAGKGLSATGRGMTAIGESRAAKAAGKYAGPTAIFGHPVAAAAEVAVPPALRGLGGAFQRGGAALERMDIPASLRALGETDIGAAINRTLTPPDVPLTADELAAQGVRASVGAARDMEAGGMSRAQAAQRSGAPYGGDLKIDPDTGAASNKYGRVEQGTHPGQDVEAHRPYRPAVRGQAGNTIRKGQNSPFGNMDNSERKYWRDKAAEVGSRNEATNPAYGLADDVVGVGNSQRRQPSVEEALAELHAQNPSPYETGIGAREPMSPEFMNRAVEEFHRRPGNTQSVNLATANTDVIAEARKLLDEKLGYKVPGAVDISKSVAPEVALGKLSHARHRSRAFRSNSPLAEGY